MGCNPGDFVNVGEGECPEPIPNPPSGFGKLIKKVFDRVNTASGPYQMVTVLGDAIVFRCTGSGTGARDNVGTEGNTALVGEYMEEVTSEYLNEHYGTVLDFQAEFAHEDDAFPRNC
jgi:hypothetical protein